jgi:hypothetical protein
MKCSLLLMASLVVLCSTAWAGEVACDNLPADSFSRIECERNAARVKALPAPDATPAQVPQKSELDQICGPRPVATTTSSSYAERKAEADWKACFAVYLQRLEAQKKEREKIQKAEQEAQSKATEEALRNMPKTRRTTCTKRVYRNMVFEDCTTSDW